MGKHSHKEMRYILGGKEISPVQIGIFCDVEFDFYFQTVRNFLIVC